MFNSFYINIVVFICTFSIGFILFLPYSYAQVKYAVSPLIIDTEVEARDIISKKITVTNTGSQPVTVYPTVNNISLSDGGGIEKFLAPVESDRTRSLASWIEISRLGVDLKSGESKEFNVTLRINPEPVPGTYHAFIGFGNGRNRDEAEKQVAEGQAPGTTLTVTIESKKVEALKLSGFSVRRFITAEHNEGAVFTFKNPGDETLVPKGEIILYDSKGKEVAALPVNEDNVAIEAGGEHSFVASLPAKGFGKYKAFLSVEYGTKQRASLQDTNFYYVFPLRSILILLSIVVLLVACSAWYVHKKYLTPTLDDSDRLTFRVRDTQSAAHERDVILKQ